MIATRLVDKTPLRIVRSKFPDGQVHVKVDDPDGNDVRITARIANGDDLLAVLLAEEAFRSAGATVIHLIITYLLGARMDRRIADGQPFTLRVVANLLRNHFTQIQIVDPHSQVACDLLDALPILPIEAVRSAWALAGCEGADAALCAPDAGSVPRVSAYAAALGVPFIQCTKHRDSETGRLSDFRLDGEQHIPKRVLIADDICDGGGTFAAVGKLLKEKGAEWVGLYVTHGIFSKGTPIENIDQIYTTRSYREATYEGKHVKVLDFFGSELQ